MQLWPIPAKVKSIAKWTGLTVGPYVAVGLVFSLHDRFSSSNKGQPSSAFTFGWWSKGVLFWPFYIPEKLKAL